VRILLAFIHQMMPITDYEAMTEKSVRQGNGRGHLKKKLVATLKVLAGVGSILLECRGRVDKDHVRFFAAAVARLELGLNEPNFLCGQELPPTLHM
jgi:hypothetical protein